MEKPRILIVEDEAITALDLRSRLKRAGYDVIDMVSSGEQAIQTVADCLPDLTLMDIRLDGEMDGITAAKAIRSRFGTPIIFLTAHADAATLERAKAIEPHGYLVKPFEEKEIRSTIEMALYKHKMERQVRESEQWLSTTLRSIGDAVIATDAEGRVRFMNVVAEDLTGWTQQEALTRGIEEVFVVLKENTFSPVRNPVLEAIRENAVVELEANCVIRNKEGHFVPIDDSAAPMRDDGGRLIGGVLVFRDITERRRAEEAIAQHTRDLEQRNRELDAFAHTVAHDLKTPLNLVIGFSEYIDKDHDMLDPEELAQYLRIINRNGTKMNNIIDELLLLSEVRKHEAETVPLDMGAVVSAAKERLDHLFERHQAQVKVPDTWPVALGYGPWIEEVWVNYLSNALKYGGEPPRIELGASRDGQNIRFWVGDKGPGITPEDQDRLFTPFTRLEQTRAEGHGLGLSVVQRIMDKLGGQVGVESRGVPGKGSVFFFTLPHANGSSVGSSGGNGRSPDKDDRQGEKERENWTRS